MALERFHNRKKPKYKKESDDRFENYYNEIEEEVNRTLERKKWKKKTRRGFD